MDKIGQWLTDQLKDVIRGELTFFLGFFNDLFSDASLELQTTPDSFAGSAGSEIIAMILNLANTIIMPIAAAILAYNFAKGIFELINQHNNGADFDFFGFFKVLLKIGLSAYITSNCFTLIQGFFDVGSYMVGQVSSTSILLDVPSIVDSIINSMPATDALGALGDVVVYFLLGLLMGLIFIVVTAIILITIWTRLINIYILIVLSPIPFATILGSGSLGQIGVSYIKNVLATALQGLIIAILMAINSTIVTAYFSNVATMLDLLKILILLITSALTISKSLSLAKTAVGLAG